MGDNDFLTGGLVLGILAVVANYFKNASVTILEWFKRKYTTKIEFDNFETTYQWGEEWLNANFHKMQTNHLRVVRIRSYSDGIPDGLSNKITVNEQEELPGYQFIPIPGLYTFRHLGKRVVVNYTRTRSESILGDKAYFENISIWYWGKDQTVAREIIEEARSYTNESNKGKTLVYINDGGSWDLFSKKDSRSLDTVILSTGIKESLIADIDNFYKSRDLYHQMGVQWKRSFLFEGPPGNGKTSTILAIAAHFGMSIYSLHLSSLYSDTALLRRMSEVPPNCILLIEDGDATFNGRKNTSSDSNLTFSGFLNVLDGATSQDGQIIFMTTNHVDKLDPAMIRRGRIDRQIHYPNPDKEQIEQMYQKFFPQSNGEASKFAENQPDGTNMASIQEDLWEKLAENNESHYKESKNVI